MCEPETITDGFAQEVTIKLAPPVLLAIPALIAAVVGVFTSRWVTVTGLLALLVAFVWGVDRMMIGEPPPDWKPADPVDTVMLERGITGDAEHFRELARSVAKQRGLTLKTAAYSVANELVPRDGAARKTNRFRNLLRPNGNSSQ